MGQSSFFSRLKGGLKDKDEGPTAEEIDAEVAAAVSDIKTKKTPTVSGSDILRPRTSDGKPDNIIYIMDLAPIFRLIGGRNGRIAESLMEQCGEVFHKHSQNPKDQATFEGNLFLMRFIGLSGPKGMLRAALAVNEIGKGVLGDSFVEMDVEGLLIAADVNDISDADGGLDPAKVAAALEDGGEDMGLPEPPPGAPKWLRLRWEQQREVILKKAEKAGKKAEAENAAASPSHDWAKRKGDDRRRRRVPIPHRDRRTAFDRRGRGH